MNQRQWIPISESPSDNLKNIKRVNLAIVAAVTVVSLIVGIVLSQLLIVGILGLVVSSVFVLAVMRSIESSLLNQLDLVPANEHDHARLINVVDGLCVVSGDRRPHLFIVHETYPVAFAIASPGHVGTVLVSDSLLAEMDRVEIESVMAHILWRLRTGNVALTCYLLALSAMLSKIGLGKLASVIIGKVSEEKILLWADLSACQATRYPPALISALQKCNRTHQLHLPANTGPLLFVDPQTVGDDTNSGAAFSILGFAAVPVEERIAVLKEI